MKSNNSNHHLYSKALDQMRFQIILGIIILCLTSCDQLTNVDQDAVVARVGTHLLYLSDIEEQLPPNISKDDSILLAQNAINLWAKKHLLYDQAVFNLDQSSQTALNALVEDYRLDLWGRTYKESLVKSVIDTIVDTLLVQSYYEKNQSNFSLTENVLQARVIGLSKSALNLTDVKFRFQRNQEEDKRYLDSLRIQFTSYQNKDSIWYTKRSFQEQFPSIPILNFDNYLKKSQFFFIEDSFEVYLLWVSDYRLRNEYAPFQLVENTIRKIVFNQSKLEFIKQFDQEILQDAIQATSLKYILSLFLFVINLVVFAQGPKADIQGRIKLDGVVAVVGDYVILDSDIDKTLTDMESQGISTKGVTRCELIGKLMEDKLYAHHAVQDSLEVSDAEVYSYVDQSIEYFTQQLGSLEKVLEFYNKTDELSFRDELFEINKVQKLSQLMQADIIEKVEITPEEVREFFESIPKDDLPVFGTELEIAQIVIEPRVKEDERKRIIAQLNGFKNDVEEKGLSFASKAILYSQDPGSRSSGGKYTLHRKRPRMAKEFRNMAFSLEEGEVSAPFKTEFGWHILTVDKIRGQEIDIRHILLMPEVDNETLTKSKAILDSIRVRILDEEISFEDAAFNFSYEKETRNNGGKIINPVTGDTRFELTKMDPELYNQVKNLETGEITLPLLEQDRGGAKKYKILKVVNRYEEHLADYSQDYTKIKDLALRDKQVRTVKKWIREKIEDTFVSVNKSFRDCEFSNNWTKK